MRCTTETDYSRYAGIASRILHAALDPQYGRFPSIRLASKDRCRGANFSFQHSALVIDISARILAPGPFAGALIFVMDLAWTASALRKFGSADVAS
jgi:hypothetical protein